MHDYCWLLCDYHKQEVKVYTLFLCSSTSQVSHTHTGGMAQDKTKSFHPEKAVRQASKGTASFTLHMVQSIIWSLLEEPEAEMLCLVRHLVAEISTSATRKTFPSVFYDSIELSKHNNGWDIWHRYLFLSQMLQIPNYWLIDNQITDNVFLINVTFQNFIQVLN